MQLIGQELCQMHGAARNPLTQRPAHRMRTLHDPLWGATWAHRYSSYFRTNESGHLRDITHEERVSEPDPGSVPVVDGRRDSIQ